MFKKHTKQDVLNEIEFKIQDFEKEIIYLKKLRDRIENQDDILENKNIINHSGENIVFDFSDVSELLSESGY